LSGGLRIRIARAVRVFQDSVTMLKQRRQVTFRITAEVVDGRRERLGFAPFHMPPFLGTVMQHPHDSCAGNTCLKLRIRVRPHLVTNGKQSS